MLNPTLIQQLQQLGLKELQVEFQEQKERIFTLTTPNNTEILLYELPYSNKTQTIRIDLIHTDNTESNIVITTQPHINNTDLVINSLKTIIDAK